MEEQPRKKDLLFIINPISGIGKQKNIEELIREFTDTSIFDYTVKFTKGPGHGTELANEAVASGVDVVVAIGGDGTVNEIGQALVGSEIALGIIPTGSGNGLARHLKIPFSFEKAIDVINHCKIRKIDTATINGQIFLSIAGVGYDAFVAKKFASAPKEASLLISGLFLTNILNTNRKNIFSRSMGKLSGVKLYPSLLPIPTSLETILLLILRQSSMMA